MPDLDLDDAADKGLPAFGGNSGGELLAIFPSRWPTSWSKPTIGAVIFVQLCSKLGRILGLQKP